MAIHRAQVIFNFNAEISFLNKVASKIFLYPLNDRRLLYGYYVIFLLIVLTIVQLLKTLDGLSSLTEFTNVAPNIGVCLVTILKYTVIRNNEKFFEAFFKHFSESIWQTIDDEATHDLQVASKYTFISKLLNRGFLYYSLPLIVVIDAFPFIIMKIETEFLGRDQQYLYPFDGWYPFDKEKWFIAIYLYESIMTGLVIFIYMYADMINVFSVISVCMALKMLGNSIRNLITEEDIEFIVNGRNTDDVQRGIRMRLRNILLRHEFLADMCKHIDKMLGLTMFVNYTFGSVLLCLTSFTFTVTTDLFQKIRCFYFFLSLMVVVLDHCVIGQVIADHSQKLTEDVYSSNWTYADRSTKRTLLILMLRTQKPFELTAKGYIAMNLNTFTAIISSSYQFFNLLRTVYHDTKFN